MILATGRGNGTRKLANADEDRKVSKPYEEKAVYQARGSTTAAVSMTSDIDLGMRTC